MIIYLSGSTPMASLRDWSTGFFEMIKLNPLRKVNYEPCLQQAGTKPQWHEVSLRGNRYHSVREDKLLLL